jgi:hypothetical protein
VPAFGAGRLGGSSVLALAAPFAAALLFFGFFGSRPLRFCPLAMSFLHECSEST